MSIQDTAPEGARDKLKPLKDETFCFECHPNVPCFTECCRKLELLLTPYDILRLRQVLGMDAGKFLERYTDLRFDEQKKLPMIYLVMRDDERETCPFVAPEGCKVYDGRPSACRTYPLARASRTHRMHHTVLESYFTIHEDHCRGFEETRVYTVKGWIEDQGLAEYHEMNDPWMEIVTHPTVQKGLPEKQQQMFYLASYNLDRFRAFLFGSRFLQMFKLSDAEIQSFRDDDKALLRFAYRWLRYSLLADSKALELREEFKPKTPGGQLGK